MSYCIEVFSDEPIIVYTLQNDFFGPAERERAENAVCAALDDQDSPTFVIVNIQTTLNFNSLLDSINADHTMIFEHPNLWESVSITALPATNTNAQNPGFPTVNDAIEYIRSQYGAAQVTNVA